MLDAKSFFRDFQARKYHMLTLALVIFTVLSPFATDTLEGKLWFSVLFFFTMIGVTNGIRGETAARWILPLLGVVAITFGLLGHFNIYMHVAARVCLEIFFIFSIVVFFKDTFSMDSINSDHLYGAICIYLLIGLAYATIYLLINLFYPHAFAFSYTTPEMLNPMDFNYFSFITLTTVGFGDIIPTLPIARSFVMLESITGIFYLAILVSHLSAVFYKRSHREE